MKLTKLLALVMALAMVFSFAACSSSDATEETTAAETTTAAEETTAAAVEGPEIKDITDKATIDYDFTITVNGTALTKADLADCSFYKITVETINSKGNASEATYCGYAILDVLKVAGVEDATTVTYTCSDGYEPTEAIEITEENAPYILIAVEKDKENDADGEFWFAPCLSTTSGDYGKDVVAITAE